MPEEEVDTLELTGSAYDILESLLNECFDTIRTSNLSNFGEKTIFLERAISQDWQGLSSLFNKVFRTDLAHKKLVLNNIDFIKALKCIHDLYTNSPLKPPGIYGAKPQALEYYMPSCVVEMEKVRYTIKKLVDKEIANLKSQHLQVNKQRSQWYRNEPKLLESSGWTEYLDLTQDQQENTAPLVQTKFFLNFDEQLPEILTPKQLLLLMPGVEKVLLNHVEKVKQLKAMFDLESLVYISANALFSLLKFIPELSILAGLKIPEEFIDDISLDELEAVVSLDELIELQPAKRLEILKNAASVLFLLVKIEDLKLLDLFEIESKAREKILIEPDVFYALTFHRQKTKVEIFKKLAPLLEELNFISLETIRRSPHFISLITQTEAILFLLKNKQVPFGELISEPATITNKFALQKILNKEKITFYNFQESFDESFYNFVFENAPILADLFENYPISLRYLSHLSVEQRRRIVSDPEDMDSQRLLKPSWPYSSSLFARERSPSEESPAKIARRSFS